MRSEEIQSPSRPSRAHWCELVDVHQSEIYSYVYRMVHDHAVAADLTQEIFVRIFTSFDSYDPARPRRAVHQTETARLVQRSSCRTSGS